MKFNEKQRAYISGILMAIIFGLSFVFIKEGLKSLTPMVLLAYRFFTAAIIISILLVLKIIKVDYSGKPIKGILLLSIFYPVIAFFFETFGIKYVTVSQAGIMVSLMPVYLVILGVIILKEIPTNIQKICIGISVLGVIVTVIFARDIEGSSALFGIICLLISTISGSINNILSRKYSIYFTPVEITFAMIWIGALFFLFVAIIQGLINQNIFDTFVRPMLNSNSLISIIYLGFFTSIIAFFAMNYMLSKLPAVNSAAFINITTLISILAGVIIMHDAVHWYQIVGGILIISGGIGTNYRAKISIERI